MLAVTSLANTVLLPCSLLLLQSECWICLCRCTSNSSLMLPVHEDGETARSPMPVLSAWTSFALSRQILAQVLNGTKDSLPSLNVSPVVFENYPRSDDNFPAWVSRCRMSKGGDWANSVGVGVEEKCLSGPIVEHTPYPEVLVAKAYSPTGKVSYYCSK